VDRVFVDELVEHVMSDLVQRILNLVESQYIPSLPDETTNGSVQIDIGSSDGSVLMCFHLSDELAIALRKSVCAISSSITELSRRNAGLERQDVGIGVFVGTASLTLQEFKNLTEDDVLVIDANLDQPLPLTVNKQVTHGLCGTIAQHDTKMMINISNINDGEQHA